GPEAYDRGAVRAHHDGELRVVGKVRVVVRHVCVGRAGRAVDAEGLRARAVAELVPADLERRVRAADVLHDERGLEAGGPAERLRDVRQVIRRGRHVGARGRAGWRGRGHDEAGRVDVRVHSGRAVHDDVEELGL